MWLVLNWHKFDDPQSLVYAKRFDCWEQKAPLGLLSENAEADVSAIDVKDLHL